ncbi:unnamed protein product [Rhizoctonia solani]|uniref:Nephrocystin 3-like N-terminal domain-containing protein n=1 Tax=Rhizoctonia solani TaxID=456999 RepID=A0A8H3A8N5_9AGAM|nr:unnamed protein product [Rhizoctonia solani]CAE6417927.1 unnamed protein product [Rhizoctonia solani]
MVLPLQDKLNTAIRCIKKTSEFTRSSSHSDRFSNGVEESMTTTQEPSRPDTPLEAARERRRTSIKLVKRAKKAGKATYAGIESVLRTLEKFAEVFPPLGSILRSVAAVLDQFKQKSSCRENYEKLEEELGEMEATLKQFAELEFDPDERNSRVSYILNSIQEETGRLKEKPARSKMFQALEAGKDEARIDECRRRIGIMIHQLQLQISFITLRNSGIQLRTSLLQQLSPARYARYDSSYSTALVRENSVYQPHANLQQDLYDWARNDESSKVYWMIGTADTSMTAVAYNMCEWLVKDSETHLGASFFCSTESPWSDSNRILPTIAYQLAQRSIKFQSYLCKILEKDPDISVLNLERQLSTLILNKLLHEPGAIDKGTVVVIDALDECIDRGQATLMAEALLERASELPFKLFVTSRREPPIKHLVAPRHPLAQKGNYHHLIRWELAKDHKLPGRDQVDWGIRPPFGHRMYAQVSRLLPPAPQIFWRVLMTDPL